MALRLGPLLDYKPVRIAVELPAAVHRDLAAYADALARETGHAVEPQKLIAPMLAKFMAADRGFAKGRATVAGTRHGLPSKGGVTGMTAPSADTTEPSVTTAGLAPGPRDTSV